ncbi:MAG: tetratricopeptide repeat protein [Chloroflexi bacterium]|nr:tetratricopeptide repeat protein [Chloroflexota bacterium]
MKNFFISYNSADRAWAEWIAWELESANYSVTIQAWDFRAGANFVLEMQRAASEAERTLAVLSPNFLASLFTQPEWAAAFARDPTGDQGILVPIRVRECDPRGLLAQIIYIDLVGLDELAARKKMLAGVQRGRAKPQTAPQFPSATPATIPPPRRFPAQMPAIWNLPHQRNPNFTGRAQLLDDLRGTLVLGKTAAVTQAIHGLGGVGKTQLAVEYAYRHASDYDLVWWLRAEIPATLASDYAQLAQPLNLRDKDAQDQRVVIDAVRAHLLRDENWLLIFDNANASDEIRAYLPQGNAGNVIITSRNSAWHSVANALPIREMPRADAVNFLFKRTGADVFATLNGVKGKQSPNRDLEIASSHPSTRSARSGSLLAMTDAAEKLADELGNLPLALEQAGAFIEASGESFAEYLEIFKTHRAELLKKHQPADYAATVATTWEISIRAVEKQSPAASALMNLCAFFAPDDIPQNIIVNGAKHLPTPLADAVADALKFDEIVIAPLLRYSLIERRGAEFSIHRLVQAVIRERITNKERKKYAEAAAKIVRGAFPSGIQNNVESWKVCARLLSHALATANNAAALSIAPKASAYLFNQAGLYLKVRAQFADAKQLLERALAIDEAAFGPNHPKVAAAVNNLGCVLQDLGDLAGARKHFERSLAIWEKSLGSDHPKVAAAVNNLGSVLQDLGDLAGARKHNERALAIDEAAFGPNHPNVATDVNNLGSVLYALGDLDGARKHYERALAIDEAAFGPNHPNVATHVSWIGTILQQSGDLVSARKHFERALRIFTEFLGENHPSTVTVRKNLEAVEQRTSSD